MTPSAIDPRVVANAILDIGDKLNYEVTHLALQKLLYFSHGLHLLEHKIPLVSGHFEAWKNGPVHPLIYRSFKDAGRNPIRTRAAGLDVLSGKPKELPALTDERVLAHLARVVSFYGRLPPLRLVQISHAERGPWWQTVNKARKSVALGMRITDAVTSEWFRFQNVSVVKPDEVDEVYEVAPFASDGPRSDRAAFD
jgi:uncharacterized phage-associated protein